MNIIDARNLELWYGNNKALKNICKALGVPYQQLMYTYDKQLSEEQESYGFIKHIAYNKVLAIDTIHGLIDCPDNISSASLAIKIRDTSMEPKIKANEYIKHLKLIKNPPYFPPVNTL